VATLPPGSVDPGIEGLEVVALPEPGLDMFASFVIGLHLLVRIEGWQRLVVLPVDHPLVLAATVRGLAEAEGSAVIPSYRGKHGHPICLGRSTVEAVVRRELAGPTIRDVLREVGSTDLVVEDPGVIANCNTPAALAEAWRNTRV
jgi:CTP:molybdopterin cytidylyltransferase MocA